MTMPSRDRNRRTRGRAAARLAREARARPDYHDPTAGLGGAPPARSALTLRLILAVFGLVICAGAALGFWAAGLPAAPIVAAAVLAAFALTDLLVVLRRKRRGEPG